MYDPDDNAKKSYDVAISSLRERLEASKVVIGDCTLYCEDCREVLPALDAVDSLITDPPYGVGFAGKVTKHSNRRGISPVYNDDEEEWISSVLPAVETALALSRRAAVFTGIRKLQLYPLARDIGGIITPNGGGMSPWGFGCYQPVLFYGSSPHIGGRPTAIVMYHPGMHVTGENDIEHPCPKPIAFMNWAIARASLISETILDPFMGSGTTGVACVKLGRKFIGIERERKYFDIACRRIEQAYAQGDLFVSAPSAKAKQLDLEDSLSGT